MTNKEEVAGTLCLGEEKQPSQLKVSLKEDHISNKLQKENVPDVKSTEDKIYSKHAKEGYYLEESFEILTKITTKFIKKGNNIPKTTIESSETTSEMFQTKTLGIQPECADKQGRMISKNTTTDLFLKTVSKKKKSEKFLARQSTQRLKSGVNEEFMNKIRVIQSTLKGETLKEFRKTVRKGILNENVKNVISEFRQRFINKISYQVE